MRSGEPERRALTAPIERQARVGDQLVRSEIGGLFSVEDRRDDIGRKDMGANEKPDETWVGLSGSGRTFWVKDIHALIAHRHAASRTGGRVAGAAEGLGAARTRILAGGLREMQAFVTDHACGLKTQSPVAGRRLGHANERMPVEMDRALAFAAPDKHLQALNGDEQLQGLDPIDGDAQGVIMSKITKFGPVLALDRRD